MSARLPRLVIALLVAVLLAGVLTAWLATRPSPSAHRPALDEKAAYTAGTVEQAPDGSLQAVADLLPVVLGYDHRTLDEDLAAAKAALAGDYAREYETTFEATVRPLATSARSASQAQVRAVGLVSTPGEDEAVVLAFVDQVLVTSKKAKATQDPVKVSQVRVRVSVQRGDEGWRISGIDPL